MALQLPHRDSVVWTLGLIGALFTYIYQHQGTFSVTDLAALAGIAFAWMKSSPTGWFNSGK